MPLGRLYQAPTTVARNTPVFGYNGLKSVSNSDLVITGQAVRAKKSKSPSPGGVNNGPSAGPSPSKGTSAAAGSSIGHSVKNSSSSPPRQNGTRKSPSPGVRGSSRSTGVTPKARLKAVQQAGKESKAVKENKTNNNHPSGELGEVDNPKREKSWSPEENGERGKEEEEEGERPNDNERVRVGAERLKISEDKDKVLHNGNPRSQASLYVGKKNKGKRRTKDNGIGAIVNVGKREELHKYKKREG